MKIRSERFSVRSGVARLRRVVRGACLVLAALAAGGCAVLTVDVDVYKGPLVNEPDVQMHQAAVMAIGAKPLLKQFRDERELAELTASRPNEASNYRSRATGGASLDFIRDHHFADDFARHANDVLSLYEDRIADPKIERLVAEAATSLADYRAHFAILRPADPEPGRTALIKRLGLRPTLRPEDRPCTDDAEQSRSALRATYAEMLVPRRFAGRGALVDLENPAEGGTSADQTFVFYDRTMWDGLSRLYFSSDEGMRGPPSIDGMTTDDRFEQFERVDLIDRSARELFPDASPEDRAEFVRRVNEIARSFSDSRAALARLLGTLLELTILVHQPQMESQAPPEARAHLIRFVLLLAHMPALSEYINDCQAMRGARDAIAPAMVRNEEAQCRREHWKNVGYGTVRPAASCDTCPAVSRKHLAALFECNPLQTATALHDIHRDTMTNKGLTVGQRRHGIVCGPMLDPPALTPINVSAWFGRLKNAVAGPFSRGRLDAGLQSLIEQFLEDSHRVPGGLASGTAESRERLLDALVQFAQKVLFVANNAVLLSEPRNSSADPQDPAPRRAEQTERTRLLQALGNSILVQVNEIAAASSHRATQEARLQAYRDDHPSETKDVCTPIQMMDRIILSIEQDQRDAVTTGTQADIDRANAALELAIEQRARMVYIRPPSFYLKNSYPVSSYQGNATPGQWQNMLGRHGLRSTPFFGEALANAELDLRAAKAQAEIDKQFWQNINRVRVAGGGATNYVLMKDAVGNWGVRNYSADPTPIIEAARAAAMLASAGVAKPGAPAPVVASGEEPLLERQRKAVVESYRVRSLDELKNVRVAFEGLPAKLGARAAALNTDAIKALYKEEFAALFEPGASSDSFAALDDAVGAKAGDDETGKEHKVGDTLLAARRFLTRAKDVIDRLPAPAAGAGATDPRPEAHTALGEVVTAPLKRLLDARIATLEWYRTSLAALQQGADSASK